MIKYVARDLKKGYYVSVIGTFEYTVNTDYTKALTFDSPDEFDNIISKWDQCDHDFEIVPVIFRK